MRSLARDLDMHRTTVDECLGREQVKQPRQPVLSEAELDEAEAAHLAGDSWVTIGRRFAVDPGTVGRRPEVPASVAALRTTRCGGLISECRNNP